MRIAVQWAGSRQKSLFYIPNPAKWAQCYPLDHGWQSLVEVEEEEGKKNEVFSASQDSVG